MAEWVGIVVTALLTGAALFFGNSLRLKMRSEVEAKELSHEDIAFLEACKVNVGRAPWRDALERQSAHQAA
jgi:hypothetical protein